MQLDEIQRDLTGDFIQQRVIRIDNQRDLSHADRCFNRQRSRLGDGNIARAFGEEHKTDVGRTCIAGSLKRGLGFDAANFDPNVRH